MRVKEVLHSARECGGQPTNQPSWLAAVSRSTGKKEEWEGVRGNSHRKSVRGENEKILKKNVSFLVMATRKYYKIFSLVSVCFL